MAHQLTLYHYWRSSCSWRVRWALELKGIPYAKVAVNILAKETQAPEYLAKNPAGFVPALAVDGRVFSESLAICAWLDETWPEPALLPRDPFARLLARQLALTIAAGTQPQQNPSLVAYYVKAEGERPAHMRHWIERGLGVYDELVRRGQPGKFSVGDEVTIADICLVPQLYNARRFGVDVAARFPRLAAIEGNCLKTKACEAAAPQNQEGAS